MHRLGNGYRPGLLGHEESKLWRRLARLLGEPQQLGHPLKMRDRFPAGNGEGVCNATSTLVDTLSSSRRSAAISSAIFLARIIGSGTIFRISLPPIPVAVVCEWRNGRRKRGSRAGGVR